MTLMFQRLLRDNSGAYNCSFDYLLFSKILFYVNCVICRLNEGQEFFIQRLTLFLNV